MGREKTCWGTENTAINEMKAAGPRLESRRMRAVLNMKSSGRVAAVGRVGVNDLKIEKLRLRLSWWTQVAVITEPKKIMDLNGTRPVIATMFRAEGRERSALRPSHIDNCAFVVRSFFTQMAHDREDF